MKIEGFLSLNLIHILHKVYLHDQMAFIFRGKHNQKLANTSVKLQTRQRLNGHIKLLQHSVVGVILKELEKHHGPLSGRVGLD